MVHSHVFYKLLGLPETVADPTAYDLLGLTRDTCTPESVKQALKDRKKRLRQNIPNSQFIPVILTFEKELDAAAAVLLDPAKSKAYDAQLLRRTREASLGQAQAQRQQVEAIRTATAAAVAQDGTLDDSARPALLKSLGRLGLAKRLARSIVAEIPTPGPQAAAPAAAVALPPPATLRYFTTAVDLAIFHGRLEADDEQRLRDLARRLEIADEVTAAEIDRRLTAKGGRRSGTSAELQRERFEKQVRTLYPEGNLPPTARANLLALASVQGLAPEVASTILDHYAPPPPAPPRPAAPLPMAQPVPQPTAQPPEGQFVVEQALPAAIPVDDEPPQTPDGERTETVLEFVPDAPPPAPAAIPLAQEPPGHVRPSAQPAPPSAAMPPWTWGTAPAAQAPQAQRPARAPREPHTHGAPDDLFGPDEDEDEDEKKRPRAGWRAWPLWNIAVPLAGVSLFAVIGLVLAARLGRQGTESGTDAEAKPATNQPTTKTPPRTRTASKTPRAPEKTRPEPPKPPPPPPQRPALLASLLQSVQSTPALTQLLAGADADDVTRAFAAAAALATDPHKPTAKQAFGLLDRIATSSPASRIAEESRKCAQLALCELMRQTTSESVARSAHATLRRAIPRKALAERHPQLLQASLRTQGERNQVAATWQKAINPPPPPAPPPPPPPVQARPIPPPTVSAEDVRRAYSAKHEPEDLLADVALTLLACCDRTVRFTDRSDRWGEHLSGLLAEANRVESLAEKVSLANAEPAEDDAPPQPRQDDGPRPSVADLKDKLRARDSGARYHAIDQLRADGSQQAVDALLDELERIASLQDPSSRLAAGLKPSGARTACRILAALATMNDPRIPAKLAKILGEGDNYFVPHQIARTLGRTLIEQLGLQDFKRVAQDIEKLRLPRRNSRTERAAAEQAWLVTLAQLTAKAEDLDGRVRIPFGQGWLPPVAGQRRAAPPGRRPRRRPADDADDTWKPDPIKLKLLAITAFCAAQSAKAIKGFRWGNAPPAADQRADFTCEAPSDLAAELGEHLDTSVRHLARLARDHRNADAHARNIEQAIVEDTARALACETPLQKAAVKLDTSARLLTILVEEAGTPDARNADLVKIRTERQRAVRAASNVLRELRENAFYNLALWDLLIARASQEREP